MKPSAITNSITANVAPKLAKHSKKVYVAPKSEVIELPDTPKLLATGRWYEPNPKKVYVKPEYKVYELEDTPKLLATGRKW